MSDEPAIVYLEADDEVTSVVRRVRSATAGRIVIVAPGRSRAVSSVVALRLLARAASDADRTVAVVGDALTRSLAAEAGVDTYATLEDARGSIRDPEAPAPRRATISVVRGAPSEDTAPTLAAGAARAVEPEPVRPDDAVARASDAPHEDSVATVRGALPDDPTRPHPIVARPAPVSRESSGGATARAGIGAGVLALSGLLLVAVLGAAVVLPAATVTIRPVSVPVGPATYAIEDAPAERRSGTVEATATVTATGTYSNVAPASGTVVLFNWTFVPVRVPAGTFVAAGEQAFATQAEVVVPRGSLTGDGRIAAGDIAVAVVAAAAGPMANVPAEAIDTVVNESIDAQLRGFPENPERRVTNPEPTAGGLDASGPEILQEDVDAAVAVLREQLAAARSAALPSGAVVAVPPDEPEPTIEGLDALVGTRDEPTAEIRGSQEWEAWILDTAAVEAEALDRFAGDGDVVPAGHELLPDATDLAIAGTSVGDDGVTVEVRVGGRAVPIVDRAAAVDAVQGRSTEDAEAALAAFGDADVALWPFWVSTVPSLDWRIGVEVVGPTGAPAPSGSGSSTGSEPSP